jgi:hypothetical protein
MRPTSCVAIAAPPHPPQIEARLRASSRPLLPATPIPESKIIMPASTSGPQCTPLLRVRDRSMGRVIVDNAHYQDSPHLLDAEKPDILFAHWLIDKHRALFAACARRPARDRPLTRPKVFFGALLP